VKGVGGLVFRKAVGGAVRGLRVRALV